MNSKIINPFDIFISPVENKDTWCIKINPGQSMFSQKLDGKNIEVEPSKIFSGDIRFYIIKCHHGLTADLPTWSFDIGMAFESYGKRMVLVNSLELEVYIGSISQLPESINSEEELKIFLNEMLMSALHKEKSSVKNAIFPDVDFFAPVQITNTELPAYKTACEDVALEQSADGLIDVQSKAINSESIEMKDITSGGNESEGVKSKSKIRLLAWFEKFPWIDNWVVVSIVAICIVASITFFATQATKHNYDNGRLNETAVLNDQQDSKKLTVGDRLDMSRVDSLSPQSASEQSLESFIKTSTPTVDGGSLESQVTSSILNDNPEPQSTSQVELVKSTLKSMGYDVSNQADTGCFTN